MTAVSSEQADAQDDEHRAASPRATSRKGTATNPQRLVPPRLTPDILVRPELIDLLTQRFERRVVTLIAGPGFGKTTLLAQAYAANRLAPAGADRWLRCERGDAVGSHFVQGLAASTGLTLDRLRHDVDAAVDELLGHIGDAWPDGLALLIDDVHLLAGSAVDSLRRLIREAPRCLHLVLTSRTDIPGLTLVRSRGEVVDLGEDDLRLGPSEVAEIAAGAGIAPEALAVAAGWPALTNVLARHGSDGANGWSGAMAGLDERSKLAVAELVAVGGGTVTALEYALSDPPPIGELVRSLPLMTVHPDDVVVPHQLWEHLVDGLLDPGAVRSVRGRMAGWLLATGDLGRAAPLAALAGSWGTFCEVVVAACHRGTTGPPHDVLTSWLALLPPKRRDAPEANLLRGLCARRHHPSAAETRDLFVIAGEGFRAQGHVEGEVAALGEYVGVVRRRGEDDRLEPVLVRLLVIEADGYREVDGTIRILRALLAERVGAPELMLAELDAILPGSLHTHAAAFVDLLRAEALLDLGRADEAVGAADACVAHGGPEHVGGFLASQVTRWFADDPTAALERPMADEHIGAIPSDRVHSALAAAMIHAYAGDPDRARSALGFARRTIEPDEKAELDPVVCIGAAAVAVASGDEAAATHELVRWMHRWPISDTRRRGVLLRALALAYVLVPDVRGDVERAAVGPTHATTLGWARAVVAAREEGARIELPPGDVSAQVVASRLPLRWAAELAGALDAAGQTEGRVLANSLAALHGARTRAALRAAATDSKPGTARLLRSITIDNGASVDIDLLGPPVLRVDGLLVDDGPWRRRAVRVVLAHLAARRQVTRDELLVALWPDVDQSTAEANLRSCLTHLVRVLEPHRSADEAPFLVRSDPAHVSLAGPPHVAVDVDRFDRLIDEADDTSETNPRAALAGYLEALGLWRGEPYEQLESVGWVAHEQDRLRRRFVEASLRSTELHLAAGQADQAVTRAADCLQVEPWSEDAHRLLVAAHLANRDRASARRAMDRTLVMLAELEVAPAPETRLVLRLLDDQELA